MPTSLAATKRFYELGVTHSFARRPIPIRAAAQRSLVARLVKRAQAAGQLRAGLQPTDIPFLVFLLTDAAQFARETSPEIWRRYLTLVLDGLRPEREGVTPLPVAALSPEEFELSMRQDPPRGH